MQVFVMHVLTTHVDARWNGWLIWVGGVHEWLVQMVSWLWDGSERMYTSVETWGWGAAKTHHTHALLCGCACGTRQRVGTTTCNDNASSVHDMRNMICNVCATTIATVDDMRVSRHAGQSSSVVKWCGVQPHTMVCKTNIALITESYHWKNENVLVVFVKNVIGCWFFIYFSLKFLVFYIFFKY